jgi:hypothetical protein
MNINSSGNLQIFGDTAYKNGGSTWTNPSDIRLKENIVSYDKSLNELMNINVKTWVYNGLAGSRNGIKGLGVIADEIMLVLPDTVKTHKAKLHEDDLEETEIKTFDADEITWLLVNSVKELKTELDAVKAELAVLKG